MFACESRKRVEIVKLWYSTWPPWYWLVKPRFKDDDVTKVRSRPARCHSHPGSISRVCVINDGTKSLLIIRYDITRLLLSVMTRTILFLTFTDSRYQYYRHVQWKCNFPFKLYRKWFPKTTFPIYFTIWSSLITLGLPVMKKKLCDKKYDNEGSRMCYQRRHDTS